mmetsp:Transcript_48327/g.105550  ORF Transcript_48327/g.105550 Transcript_48327/m.105550 type:complete len:218 (-) Transcript_48327:83-736(-)
MGQGQQPAPAAPPLHRPGRRKCRPRAPRPLVAHQGSVCSVDPSPSTEGSGRRLGQRRPASVPAAAAAAFFSFPLTAPPRSGAAGQRPPPPLRPTLRRPKWRPAVHSSRRASCGSFGQRRGQLPRVQCHQLRLHALSHLPRRRPPPRRRRARSAAVAAAAAASCRAWLHSAAAQSRAMRQGEPRRHRLAGPPLSTFGARQTCRTRTSHGSWLRSQRRD